jgi:hypothetical protein
MTMRVERGTDGIVRATLGKNKRGTSDLDIAFRIGNEVVGVDEDGDPISAPLVEELSGASATRLPQLSPAQREALNILNELEADGRVSETAWRDACVEGRRVSQRDDRASRRRTFNNVRKALYDKGQIAFHNGKVGVAEVTSECDDA